MYLERPLLGEVIKDFGLITQAQLDEVLQMQKINGKRLSDLLLEFGYISEDELIECLKYHLKIPQIKLSQIELDIDWIRSFPVFMLQHHQVIPVVKKNNIITLAMVDPFNVLAIEDLRLASGCEIAPVIITRRELHSVIAQITGSYLQGDLEKAVLNFKKEQGSYQDGDLSVSDPTKPEFQPLVVRLVNGILSQGVIQRASDIHVEPQEDKVRVRYRIDGLLYEVMSLPLEIYGAVVSRLKIMANLDIAERRLPQDGQIRVLVEGQTVDLRIATLPTVWGEKLMLRILNRIEAIPNIGELDIQGSNLKNFHEITSRLSGLILVCGPTGSGKTTTLYSILSYLNSTKKNIVTLEDPVECVLPGINQVQVNSRSGFHFASGLRSVLRQDPDIIMVGEIRDRETADLAVQAALTGHLVLSTLHTKRAAGAVIRLLDMGIEPFLLSSSLVGVIAQRLVRRVCPECGVKASISKEIAYQFGVDLSKANFLQGQGCTWCNHSGYWERMAIHEVMVLAPELQMLIEKRSSELTLEKTAEARGMRTLWQDGLEKASQGDTTLEEVIRAVELV